MFETSLQTLPNSIKKIDFKLQNLNKNVSLTNSKTFFKKTLIPEFPHKLTTNNLMLFSKLLFKKRFFLKKFNKKLVFNLKRSKISKILIYKRKKVGYSKLFFHLTENKL